MPGEPATLEYTNTGAAGCHTGSGPRAPALAGWDALGDLGEESSGEGESSEAEGGK